jgi:hypothetical protein
MLKEVEMWPAADERRLTLMENKWLIRVHQRSSAAKNPSPRVFQQPLGTPF